MRIGKDNEFSRERGNPFPHIDQAQSLTSRGKRATVSLRTRRIFSRYGRTFDDSLAGGDVVGFFYLLKQIFKPIKPEDIDPVAYKAGWLAFEDGVSKNPHEKGTVYYESWAIGHFEAEQEAARQW